MYDLTVERFQTSRKHRSLKWRLFWAADLVMGELHRLEEHHVGRARRRGEDPGRGGRRGMRPQQQVLETTQQFQQAQPSGKRRREAAAVLSPACAPSAP